METEPTTPAAAAPKKRRRSNWNTEVARKRHAEHKRRLGRAAAERAEREHQSAVRALRSARDRVQRAEVTRRANAITNGLTPRLTAVMKSWGVTCDVTLTDSLAVKAWTDHKRIFVGYDARLRTDSPIDDDLLRALAAETRGLFYHEVGHNLFTVPLPRIARMAWDSGFDFPPNTVVFRDTEGKPRSAFAGQQVTVDITGPFHNIWNALEDQRMESALVEDSPTIAGYLTVAVLRLIAGRPTSWVLMAGRRYLPQSVRDRSRREFRPLTGITAEEVETIVQEYCTATEPVVMMSCAVRLYERLQGSSLPVFDVHDQASNASQKEPTDPEVSRQRLEESGEKNQAARDREKDVSTAEPSEEPESDRSEERRHGGPGSDLGTESGEDAGPEDEDSADDGDFADDGADGDDSDEWNGVGGTRAGRKTGRKSESDLGQALDALRDDATLDEDVASVNHAYNTDDGSLPQYGDVQDLYDEALSAAAHGVVDDIVTAFEIATADCAPRWESGQRRGVLEPIRYKTRQPGDLEFFRQYSDDGEPGTDIAVSLFLDVSGSMGGTSKMLGATAWAIKEACHRINVDCDVSVFDERGYRVWGVDDHPDGPVSIGIGGATDPTSVFDGILSKERSKRRHIVLVMTDGVWENPHAFKDYRHNNIYSAVFFYDKWAESRSLQPDPDLAFRLLMDEAYTISNLLDIPQALERMLTSMV